jgi:DNA-directed RNA polymerase specialized sigma subunit
MKKIQGMPSILEREEMAPPFSNRTKITGVADDFDDIYTQWQQNRTPELNSRLLTSVQPVIDTALSSYAGQNQPSPALRSRAKILALKAFDSFDPQRGNVRTHLLSQLQGIRRLAAKEQNIISIPEQVGLDFQRLDTAENELRDRLSRDPTDEELADFTGLSVRRIRKVKTFHKPVASGMLDQETTEDAYTGEVASYLPGQNTAADAWLDFVYGDLGPTDKLIMDMSLGRNGRRRTSTQEIAARLNITPGAVSQRAAKIQAMIDKRYDHNF